MVTHADALLSLLDWQVNFKGLYQTKKKNPSTLSSKKLYMHPVSGIFFISSLQLIYFIIHMAYKAELFLKAHCQQKTKSKNFSSIMLLSFIYLPTFLLSIHIINSDAVLSTTTTYMQLINIIK